MTTDKQPMQADGSGTEMAPADENGELASRRGGLAQSGESGGGAYANPHTGKGGSDAGPDSFFGHGGQSEQARLRAGVCGRSHRRHPRVPAG